MARVAVFVVAGCFSCAGRPPTTSQPPSSEVHPVAPPAKSKRTPEPTPSKPGAATLLPLWAGEAKSPGKLSAPTPFQLPEPMEVADIAAESNTRAWLLGRYAGLYRLENESVVLEHEKNALCIDPRPKNHSKDEPWPSPFDTRLGHGLFATPSGLGIWLSRPGPTSSTMFTARRDKNGKLHCHLPPYFVIGGAGYAAVASGGRLWAFTYSGLRCILPDPSETVPNPGEPYGGTLVPVKISGSPPMFWPQDSWALSRFNGVLWERITLPELARLRRETVVVDEAGILWGVADLGSGGKPLLVAYDGQAWRGGPVPGLDALKAVLPVRANRAWLVGANEVAYRLGDRFFVVRVELMTHGTKVDEQGRLWVWGASGEAPKGEDPLSSTVLRFAPPKEAA